MLSINLTPMVFQSNLSLCVNLVHNITCSCKRFSLKLQNNDECLLNIIIIIVLYNTVSGPSFSAFCYEFYHLLTNFFAVYLTECKVFFLIVVLIRKLSCTRSVIALLLSGNASVIEKLKLNVLNAYFFTAFLSAKYPTPSTYVVRLWCKKGALNFLMRNLTVSPDGRVLYKSLTVNGTSVNHKVIYII